MASILISVKLCLYQTARNITCKIGSARRKLQLVLRNRSDSVKQGACGLLITGWYSLEFCVGS
jgi:hypothetical protein